MALKRLSTEEMVQLSGPWVTDGTDARQAILAEPTIAGVLPHVEAAHQGLHEAQPTGEDPRLAEVQEEAAGVDLDHDTIVRGAHGLLTSLALLCGDAAKAGELLALRDFLLPDGLETMQKSYRAESGAGSFLETRLAEDADKKKQLEAIPVLDKNLGDHVGVLLAKAKHLGELEDERAKLVSSGANPSDAAKLLAARNRWIRTVNALVANAAMAELPEATDHLVFDALRVAEKAADRRAARSAAAKNAPAAEQNAPAAEAAPAETPK